MCDLWLNPGLGDQNYIKGIVTDRLQNIFRQRYHEYIKSPENEKKCEMFNKCNNVCHNIMIDGYTKKRYLTENESPDIRSIFTKL